MYYTHTYESHFFLFMVNFFFFFCCIFENKFILPPPPSPLPLPCFQWNKLKGPLILSKSGKEVREKNNGPLAILVTLNCHRIRFYHDTGRFFGIKISLRSLRKKEELKKIDRVGPVDNRPSTDNLHHFVRKKEDKNCDIWHMTCDIWHITCDTWHVTCDTQEMMNIL